MAIYHFSAQVICRSKGRSSVACAAYRSGEMLEDERTGITRHYLRVSKPEAFILAPEFVPEWVYDCNRLWNEVEKAERRFDAQVAREINVALPRELTRGEQRELVRSFVQEQFVDQGMVADVAIHRDDANNPHFHVMLTTRSIHEGGFDKKNWDWNQRGLLKTWRRDWANHANNALEKAGFEKRITHLSLKDQNLETLPTQHLGPFEHAREKRGISTPTGNLNREIQKANQEIIDLKQYRDQKQLMDHQLRDRYTETEKPYILAANRILKKPVNLEAISERQEQMSRWEKKLGNRERELNLQRLDYQEADKARNEIERLSEIANKRTFGFMRGEEAKRAQEEIARLRDRLSHLSIDPNLSLEETEARYKTEMEKIQTYREQIEKQRNVLDHAKVAYKNAVIRDVVDSYSERDTAGHLSYEDALKLKAFNEKEGRIVPIQEIKDRTNILRGKVQELHGKIESINRTKNRLNSASKYVEEFKKWDAEVQKFEQNRMLKMKFKVSRGTQESYQDALASRDQFLSLMQQNGVQGVEDFELQRGALQSMEMKRPELEHQMESSRGMIDILGAISQGIQAAEQQQRMMEMERSRRLKRSRKMKLGR